LRHAGCHRACLLIGVDRKPSTRPQNDAFDPKETNRFAPRPSRGGMQQGNDGDGNAKVGTHDRMPLVKHARFVELLDQPVIHQSIDLNIEHAGIMQ
jgi:hypothetical protein